MITIHPLGGSGEYGRNCILLEWDDGAILLDCGVKQDISAEQSHNYPLLTTDIANKIRAVFLSQSHQDHAAALPLLYHLGYHGKVFASVDTINTSGRLIKKWAAIATQHHKTLPYTSEDMERIVFAPLPFGHTVVEGIDVACGPSGHMLGCQWFSFTINGKKILFSPDMALHSPVLQATIPPRADYALYSCALAGKTVDLTRNFRNLVRVVEDTADNGGKVLIPVPSKGRSSALYLVITSNCNDMPIYVDREILDNIKLLSRKPEWAKPFSFTEKSDNIHIIRNDKERKAVCADPEPSIILTRDGMLTAPSGRYYFEQLRHDPANIIIFTGYTAKGTLGQLLFNETYCHDNHIRIRKTRLLYKEHLDNKDLLEVNATVKAKKALLYHCEPEQTPHLIESLAQQGTEARYVLPGETWQWE